jgi:hypothetical protein
MSTGFPTSRLSKVRARQWMGCVSADHSSACCAGMKAAVIRAAAADRGDPMTRIAGLLVRRYDVRRACRSLCGRSRRRAEGANGTAEPAAFASAGASCENSARPFDVGPRLALATAIESGEPAARPVLGCGSGRIPGNVALRMPLRPSPCGRGSTVNSGRAASRSEALDQQRAEQRERHVHTRADRRRQLA